MPMETDGHCMKIVQPEDQVKVVENQRRSINKERKLGGIAPPSEAALSYKFLGPDVFVLASAQLHLNFTFLRHLNSPPSIN